MIGLFGQLILLSLCTAALSHFLQMTMKKGMINRWYKYYITYFFHFKPRKKYVLDRAYPDFRSKYAKASKYGHWYIPVKEKWYAWFHKPLCCCLYCNGFWIFALFYILINIFIVQHSLHVILIFLCLGAGLNYVWQETISRYFL